MKLRALLPMGLVAMSVLALAAQAVVIKRSPKVGDKATYKVTGKFEVMGTEAVLSGSAAEEVTKIDGDKVITTTVTKSAVNVMGQEMAQPDRTEVSTSKLDGTYVESKSNDVAPTAGELRLAHLTQTYLPGTEVKVDGTWVLEGKKDEKLGTPAYKITYKFVGEEKVGTVDTYKITSLGSETEGDTPSKMKSTVWLSKVDGGMIKAVQELTDVVMSAEIPPLSGTIEIVRQ